VDSSVLGMSALTYEIKTRNSPVAQWLTATFPHYKEIQIGFRTAAGPARVLPGQARQSRHARRGDRLLAADASTRTCRSICR
jgi:hypothetical protein